MSPTETNLEDQMPIEQLSLLYKQSAAAFAATIAVLLYILFWVHDLIEIAPLSIWVTAVVALNIYLLTWMYFVHQANLEEIAASQAKRFILIYQFQALMHGFTWGMLPFLLIELTSPEMKFFAYVVICGMAAGAIGTTAMIFHIYLSFMLPMMLPIIISQLFLSDTFPLFSLTTLELLIIFVVSVIVLAHTHYDSVKRSITLMVENKKLLLNITQSFHRAEASSQAKSSFLANMSHELRTPLNAVIGYSEMILDNANDGEIKTIPKDAKKITKAGEHLLSLINNVLDLSKIESGKMEVFVEEINIYELLDDIKEATEALITKNANTFKFEIPDNLDSVKTDSTKLRQILYNIIGNAAKFTEQGEIIVTVTPCSNNLEISITDTGIGMTEDQLADLTTPFMQADISTTRKYGGTGLGMNLTEHLAEILGIEIQVHSVIDQGTSFKLLIPLQYSKKTEANNGLSIKVQKVTLDKKLNMQKS